MANTSCGIYNEAEGHERKIKAGKTMNASSNQAGVQTDDDWTEIAIRPNNNYASAPKYTDDPFSSIFLSDIIETTSAAEKENHCRSSVTHHSILVKIQKALKSLLFYFNC